MRVPRKWMALKGGPRPGRCSSQYPGKKTSRTVPWGELERRAKGRPEPPVLQILVEVAIIQAFILEVRRGVGFLDNRSCSRVSRSLGSGVRTSQQVWSSAREWCPPLPSVPKYTPSLSGGMHCLGVGEGEDAWLGGVRGVPITPQTLVVFLSHSAPHPARHSLTQVTSRKGRRLIFLRHTSPPYRPG